VLFKNQVVAKVNEIELLYVVTNILADVVIFIAGAAKRIFSPFQVNHVD